MLLRIQYLILWMRKLSSPDLVAVRRGTDRVFLVGEVFCAVNYLFLGEDSYFVGVYAQLRMALGLRVFRLPRCFWPLTIRGGSYGEAKKKCALL